MNTPIEELINVIDPDKEQCKYCDCWVNRFNAFTTVDSISLNIHLTKEYNKLCIICAKKINYISVNHSYIKDELEFLKSKVINSYVNVNDFDRILNDNILVCYHYCREIISNYERLTDAISYKTLLKSSQMYPTTVPRCLSLIDGIKWSVS